MVSLELEQRRAEAWRLLTGFLNADANTAIDLTLQLKPRDEDWSRVFIGESAERARLGYTSLWSAPVAPLPKEGQVALVVNAALAAELQVKTERTAAFPGAYATVAFRFQPERVWIAWKYTRPGETTGMAWDGLVWVDDHWAWFPKPWRVLGAAT